MSKYAPLDELLVAAIRKKPQGFTELNKDSAINALAESLAPPTKLGDKIAWRLIDRRLQALRKVGVIEHRGGYWRVTRNF